MITDENLADGWEAATAREEDDGMMGREFESREYEHQGDDELVRIVEVQEPEDFEGWGYEVVAEHGADDPAREELGLYERLEDAREAAVEHMDATGE